MEDILKAIMENPDVVKTIIETYKPVVYSILESLFTMYKDLVNNDEYYKVLAENNWKRFSALKECGFTDDQAMAIVLHERNETWKSVMENAKSSVTLKK